MAEKLENLLETVTETEYPVIATLKEMMKQEGALNALMSGSGPTVFGIFKSKGEAEQALNRITSYNVCYTKLLRSLFGRNDEIEIRWAISRRCSSAAGATRRLQNLVHEI